MKNIDKIRAMSLEELAQFLMHIRYDEFETMIIDGNLLFTDNDIIEWLEREVQK